MSRQHSPTSVRIREPEHVSAPMRGRRRSTRHHLIWVLSVFSVSLVTVLCVIIATAWILGGRTVPGSPTVQSLLPPEPIPEPESEAISAAEAATSALRPAAGTDEEYVVGEAAAILPGAGQSFEVSEIPVESFPELKAMGWAVPHLTGFDLEPEYVETGSAEGVRTIQVQFTDGERYVNVAETRSEEGGKELVALHEKLHSVVDVDGVSAERRQLTTGDEATVYLSDSGAAWTSAVESSAVQYVITSNLPAAAATEVSSWVMVTDRSRLQRLPASPGPGDRLERGFEELAAWFTRDRSSG